MQSRDVSRGSRDEADIAAAVRRPGRRLITRGLDACRDRGRNFPVSTFLAGGGVLTQYGLNPVYVLLY